MSSFRLNVTESRKFVLAMIILLMVDNILSSPCMLSYKTSITKNSKAIIFTACNYKKEMKSNPSYGEK